MAEISIDPLKFLYINAKEKLIGEKEAIRNNLTEVFWENMEYKIDQGELLNMSIRGEVTTGKSTVNLDIMWKANKYLQKKGLHKGKIDYFRHIFSDQTEFLRFIDSGEENVFIAIDEFNKMAETGLNATTEDTLFAFYSDVFAQRFIHRGSCAPTRINDENANIILDIMGKDKESGITRCKLLYRDVIDRTFVTLGHVDFDVNDVMKQDWYRKYRTKKFKRMELLEKHGVRDIRELEFSGIVLDVIAELKDLALIGKVTHEIVLATVDEMKRKHRRIYSLLVTNDISTKCRAILSLYTELNRFNAKIAKAKKAGEIHILESARDKIREMLKNREKEQKALSQVYKEYLNIK